jgi:hypothetical protein
MISPKFLKLGKSRKKVKWLMNISAIDNENYEILQSREPVGLEEVGGGKRGMESQFREWSLSWNEIEQMSK